MDSLDKAILMELSSYCRVSYSHLAREYGVSVTTIKNRVNVLEKQRIIRGYIVRPREELFGASSGIVLFKLSRELSSEAYNLIGDSSQVNGLGIGLNREGFCAVLYRDNQELNGVSELFYSVDEISEFTVYQVLKPPFPPSIPPSKGIDALKRLDWKMILHLYDDGRKSLGDLSDEVGASVPTLRKRLDFMRENNMLDISILLNPGAIKKGFMLTIKVELPSVTTNEQLALEKMLRTELPDYFWVSWKVVDRPVLILAFQCANTNEVHMIREKLTSLIPRGTGFDSTIGGAMEYFSDFRKQFVEKMASR